MKACSAAFGKAGASTICVAGRRSCFQINLLHHPNAFLSLASGFDSIVNALTAWRGTPAPPAAVRAAAGIRVRGPAGEIDLKASPGPILVSMAVPMPRTWVRMPRIVTASAR